MISDPHDQNTLPLPNEVETVDQPPPFEQQEEYAKTANNQVEQADVGELGKVPKTDSSVEAQLSEIPVEVQKEPQPICEETKTNEGEKPIQKDLGAEPANLQDDQLDQLKEVIDEEEKNIEAQTQPTTTEPTQTKEVEASQPSDEKEKLPDSPSGQEKLIEKVLTDDEAQYNKDLKELTAHRGEIKHWQERTISLSGQLIVTNETCQKLLNDCQDVYQSFSSELKDKLKGRQDGLELIRKMLERLCDQIQAIIKNTVNLDIYQELPKLDKEAIAEIVRQQEDEDSAQKAIKQKLIKIGNERWQIVSQNREEAKSQQKKWLQFVDRKILPILDGIDDGKKYSQQLIEELKNQYSQDKESLKSWFETYDKLRTKSIDMLKEVQVYLIKIEVGKPVDYDRHEPFDVQFDEEKDDESIKEIIRQGYEYTTPINNEKKFVLRPAQVVVVKKN
jgi:molecular chaperone GrpE (heat shock protein)